MVLNVHDFFLPSFLSQLHQIKKAVVLLQGKPRDAAVNYYQ